MEYILGALALGVSLFIYLEARRKSGKLQFVIDQERKDIAAASGMTASIGVFYPDNVTSVIVGASEEQGAFYYRMLKNDKVDNRSKINLANLSRVELLINGRVHPVTLESEEPTTSLRATDISNQIVATFEPEELKNIARAAVRIAFISENGSEKTLEITSFRSGAERHQFQRVQNIKNSVWWVSFLNMASRTARHRSSASSRAS